MELESLLLHNLVVTWDFCYLVLKASAEPCKVKVEKAVPTSPQTHLPPSLSSVHLISNCSALSVLPVVWCHCVTTA